MPLTWMDGIVQNLVDGLNFFIRWRVEDNDHGADQTNGAAQLAQCS